MNRSLRLELTQHVKQPKSPRTILQHKPEAQAKRAKRGAAAYNFHIFLKGLKVMKTKQAEPDLEKVEDDFVELWNNMASLWGISPTMARIHGLLYITGASSSMDDIMARLGISRGNVSMNLSKLLEWGLVRRVHKRGDRRDYYVSISDVWEMFTLVANQRKRREIDPILQTLRRCQEGLAPTALGPTANHGAAQERLRRVSDLLQLLAMMDGLAQRFFESQRGLRTAFDLLAQDEK
jgi:HTH-type transcriptional regulator, glycine betaine synthesis regulator